jgi:serine protease Do
VGHSIMGMFSSVKPSVGRYFDLLIFWGKYLKMGTVVLIPSMLLVVAQVGWAADVAPPDFADLSESLLPAVVNVATGQQAKTPQTAPQFPPGSPFEEFFKDFFDQQGKEPLERGDKPRATFLGSGFVISSDGYIVTNNHVIAGADEVVVTFSDNVTLEATIVGRDPKTDLAVLKVESEKPLVHVKWGDSDAARIGNWVIAIGNPFGLGNTVTAGIISARARDINAGPFDDFLQTDASINRGNSGGPLFNMDGLVIGINTAIYSPTGGSVGIGFSVPSNLAQHVIHQLREYGETRRGWLGVRIQTVTEDLAENLGLDRVGGALVASVSPKSPANTAGLMVGDVILTFDGKDVGAMRRLPRIVAETQIDKPVMVEVWREGEVITLDVIVGRLDEGSSLKAAAPQKPDEPVLEAVAELGLTVSSLTNEVRTQFNLDAGVQGVMVVRVDGSGGAAEKGIRPGDLIIEIAQRKVSSPQDLISTIKVEQEEGKNTVLLLVDRQGDLQFVAVRISSE